MSSVFLEKDWTLKDIYPDSDYIVKKVTPRKKYVDGKSTDECVGYVYEVVDTVDSDILHVFVEQGEPLITQEDIKIAKNQKQKIIVQFDDTVMKIYYNDRTKSIEDSIKAKNIHVVEI